MNSLLESCIKEQFTRKVGLDLTGAQPVNTVVVEALVPVGR